MGADDAVRVEGVRERAGGGVDAGFFDSVTFGIVYQDADGSISSANPAAERILGLSLAQLQGRTSIDPRWRAVHADGSPFPGETHPAMVALRTGQRVEGVTMGVHNAGDASARWIEVSAVPLFREGEATPYRAYATFLDITARKRLDDAKEFLAAAPWLATGEDIFRAIARFLGEQLGVDFVCIDRLAGDELSAETEAVWFDGRFDDNVSYTLKETPCGDVVGKNVCSFPRGVRHLFPNDAVLQDMKAEGYLGVTLWGSSGKPIGLIALISRAPMEESGLAERTLALVAMRAAAELEIRQVEAARRLSAERLEKAFGGSPIGMVLVSPDGRFFRVNEAFCAIVGWPEADLLGIDFQSITHPDDLADDLALVADVLAGRRSGYQMDKRFVRKDGGEVWTQLNVGLVRDAQGAPLHFVSHVQDIGERRSRERERATTVERLTLALDAANAGSWEWNVKTNENSDWSDDLYRLYGLERGGVAPSFEAWLSVVHVDDRQPTLDYLAKTTPEGLDIDIEWRVVHASGATRWMRSQARALRDAEGRVERYVGIAMDIDARKLAGQALVESERRFAAAFRDAPALMSISEMGTGVYLDVNETFLRVSGFTREEVVGRSALEIGWITPDNRARLLRHLSEGGKGATIELEMRAKDGHVVPVLYSGEFIGLDGVPRLLSSALDLSERRQAEAERFDLQSQLQQAQKLEAIGRLAGGVAHDFNNMLGAILGYAEMAIGEVAPALPLHADLLEIRKAAQRSADLTRQLLTFARKQTVAPKPLNLNDAVSGMLRMLQRLIGENVQIEWQPAEGLWLVEADPSLLDQILANLCVNARDAILDVGSVVIETGNDTFDEAYCAAHGGFVPGEYVRLSVRDDGAGIAVDVLDHVFEPFFTTKAVGEGTGLGLATVYGAVRQMGGLIHVSSAPGEGATFTVHLPRHVGPPEERPSGGAVDTPRRGRETILLVEDEAAMLRVARRILEAQGYVVLAAGSPVEGVRIASEHAGAIDLLVTDLVMPGMSGVELSRRVLAIRPEVKRLFMSGYAADALAGQAALASEVVIMPKPFARAELLARVREVLDGG